MFLIDKRLTVIKDVATAKKVIDNITGDNVLVIEKEDGKFIEFSFAKSESVGSLNSGIEVRELNENSNPFNTVSIIHDKDYASRMLYANRRAYNKLWNNK